MWNRGLVPLIGLMVMALWLQACGRGFEPQNSCNFLLSSQQQRVSWKGKLPVRFHIHGSVPSQYYQAIEAAAQIWNQASPGQELIRIVGYGVSGPPEPQRDGHSVIYWMRQWDRVRSREQARTTIYWAGTQILETDILVNAEPDNHHFYPGLSLDGIKPNQVDFKSLMVHEFGHALGLTHTASAPSVMSAYLSSGVKRRDLSEQDISSLTCEY